MSHSFGKRHRRSQRNRELRHAHTDGESDDADEARTPEERALRTAHANAERKTELAGDALWFLGVTVALLIFVLPVGVVVMLVWGFKLAKAGYELELEPKLRKRFIDQEAEKLVHASLSRQLRDLEGVHAKSLELLFIERARREGDPWSGHMAMPGGRVDPGDSSAQAAAARETWEEVGLSLDGAEFLGRLDDIQGLPATARQLTVSAYVFHIETSPPLLLNHEVREAFWFPVASLMDPELHVDHPAQRGSRTHFPGILVGEPGRHVVWGLTYRFLEHFFEIVERPLPERWRFDEAP